MFWGDRIAEDIKKKFSSEIKAGETLVMRDEKTASGRVHVGSMRSVALHGVVAELLAQEGVTSTFHFEINDFDPMDGLPVYLDKDTYEPYMGMPLYKIPSPDGKAKNFAEFYGNEYLGVIKDAGFNVTEYYATELYLNGKMNDVIRSALEGAAQIRTIYKEVSNSHKPDEWFPLSVVCESCGKIGTTKVTAFDGEQVTYTCEENAVKWAKGCGHEGKISPFDGNAKLPWKVEWAGKFKVMGVQFEGAGKDHLTKGGSREVADRISREVFNYEPPLKVSHEFFLVGGKKMSSSKGAGSSAREIADLMPPHIFRLALFGSDINRQVNFDPEGDTIPLLYDRYDAIAQKYWEGVEDDGARVFRMIHTPKTREQKLNKRFLPRFSQIAFLVQMPHMKLEEEIQRMKGEALTQEDKDELHERAHYARQWLETHANDTYRYKLQETIPESAMALSDAQKQALQEVCTYITSQKTLEGQELHSELHEIRKRLNIDPKMFFSALYLSLLGKENGPKAGWFLSVLDREFLEKRLREVSA